MAIRTAGALTTRPAEDEYLAHYGKYVARVPDGDVLTTLDAQTEQTVALLDRFGEASAGIRYAPGKWSVKQVVGHMIDVERIFLYRALCAARGETASLPGFDENAYVEQGGFDARSLNSLLGELTALRRSTLSFFRNLEEPVFDRRVTANGASVTVRALAWIIAGHELHHGALLEERYAPLIES